MVMDSVMEGSSLGRYEEKDEEANKKKVRKIKLRFWFIMIGLALVYGGYISTVILQSSIRITHGLGVRITTITYSSIMFFAFLVIPAVIRLIGPKKVLILAESGYMLYVITNLFSIEPLLYVGAIGASYGESSFWVPIGITAVYFSKKYHLYSGKPEASCMMEFSGIMLSMYQISQMLGNLIISMVLNIFQSEPSPNDKTNTAFNFTNTVTPYSKSWKEEATTVDNLANYTQTISTSHLAFCGANDCQVEEIVQDSIDQYVPTNPVAFYVIIACFLLMMVLGILCHIIFVPEMPFSSFNSPKSADSKDDDFLKRIDDKKEKKSFKKILKVSFTTSKALFRQFFHPHQLLFITPFTVYCGVTNAYVAAEASRAFASCILGISQVGVCIIIYGLTDAVHSFLIGKFFGQRGRLPLLIFQLLYDLSLYILMLLWQPTEENSWFVYGLFVLLGIYNANAEMITATLFGSDFYKTKEISYNLWIINFSIGYSLLNALSTHLCVRVKLYAMIVWGIIACSTTGFHELKMRRKNNHNVTVNEGLQSANENV